MRISEAFVAATPKYFEIAGNFFMLDSVPGGTVNVVLYRRGQRLIDDLSSAIAGMGTKNPDGFDRVEITSSLNQTVAFYIAKGEVFSNTFSGNVTVTNATVNGAHAPAAKAITNVSAQILAANAARKYLAIQNASAVNDLFVRCDGVAATADAACLKLTPGQTWEPPVVPTGEIRGIRSVAEAGNNVHVIEA